MLETQADPIRVRYDHQETGWAVPIGDGHAVIENIPLSERCNIGDVVQLDAPGADSLPWVGKVVHRRYGAKSILYYYGLSELQALSSVLHALGCETEGARQPLDFIPGILLVAHETHIRPDVLAAAAGVPQPFGTPTRVAIPSGFLVADADRLCLERADGSVVAGWRAADWRAQPEAAVLALDMLLRCLGGDAGKEASLPGPAASSAGEWPNAQPDFAARPITTRFRRWRRLHAAPAQRGHVSD